MGLPALSESPEAIEALSGIELLYTDLDGTLLGRGASLLTDSGGSPAITTAEAIVRLNSTDLKAIICSGRNRLQLSEISRVLGWDGFLAELGCVVVSERGAEPLYFMGMWTGDELMVGETPYEAIVRVGAIEALQEAFPGRVEYHDPHHLNREVTHVLRGGLDASAAQEVLDSLPLPIDIVDNGIIHPPRTSLIDVEEVHAYHLIPSGATKPQGIALDLERRGLPAKHVAAIGDSATDVAMAEVASVMVLVRNALDDSVVLSSAEKFDNVYAVAGRNGAGWVEFVDAWMAARG